MRALQLILLLALFLPVATAHGGGAFAAGDSLANATPLTVPAYAFALAPAETSVHYYRFESPGGNVRVRLAAPIGQEPTSLPVLFLFGPELGEFHVPPDVEMPDGGGRSFPAVGREPMLVPALGARWTLLLERELPLEAGPHVIAIRTESAGPLALVIESASSSGLVERFILPTLRESAHTWSGSQAWPARVAGTLGVLAVAAVAWTGRKRARSFLSLTGYGAAAFFAASGMALATHAARSGAGMGIALTSIACAIAVSFLARASPARPRWGLRLGMCIVALLGFWSYAGYTWGPLFALAGALLPELSDAPKA